MSQPAIFANDEVPGSRELSTATAFDKLQELVRQGYVPDAQPLSDGILLRHPGGATLILRRDGGIDLPKAQDIQSAPASIAKRKHRISWRRSLLFLLFLAAGIILGWIMTALVFAD